MLEIWSKRLRRWFIAGLVLLAPTTVTIFIMLWLFQHLDGPVRRAIASATGYDVPGSGVLATLLIILFAGAIASSIATRGLVLFLERAVERIPIVRTLYGAVKQMITPFADEKNNPFQHVVMVEFPDAGIYSLGFLVKQNAAHSPTGEPLAAVMVPTNHGYLGFVGLYPASRIHPVDMTAEEALKFLVSMGIGLERDLQLGPSGPKA